MNSYVYLGVFKIYYEDFQIIIVEIDGSLTLVGSKTLTFTKLSLMYNCFFE